MRTQDEIQRRVQTRLKDTWTTALLAETPERTPMRGDVGVDAAAPVPATSTGWPHAFALGRQSSADIARNFGAHVRLVQAWRDWSIEHGLGLVEEARSIAGTPQQAATHVVVPDIDAAAALVGDGWPERLSVGRRRAAALCERFPSTMGSAGVDTHQVLRGVIRLSDVDFDILCRVAAWFMQAPLETRRGLTPRQVPIEGVHAKWLNAHQTLVRLLAGLDDLHLAPAHPARVHFTYLDPEHLDGGGRKHDSYSLGDTVALPYTPSVVVISENKDTAVGFPRVRGGVAVEGAGAGGGAIAALPWIQNASVVVYWGDMDIDGLEILNEFRACGLPAGSMFMDLATYAAYQRYGTNHDRNGKPLSVRPARPVPHLCGGERELYDLLTSGTAPVLRVEQERIPLELALRELSCAARCDGYVNSPLGR